MIFIVEDGTVVAGANAYCTVQFYKDYWDNKGVTVGETDEQIQAAIVTVTQYIDGNNKWKGCIVDSDQTLAWPRYGVVDNEGRNIASDIVPLDVQYATSEYASRELITDIQPDVDELGTIKSEMSKLDVMEEKTEYQDGTGGYFGIKQYPMADNYLVPYITGGSRGNFGKVGC